VAQFQGLRQFVHEGQRYVNLCSRPIIVRLGEGDSPQRVPPSGYTVEVFPTSKETHSGITYTKVSLRDINRLKEISHILREDTIYIVSNATAMYITFSGSFPGMTFAFPREQSGASSKGLMVFICN